MFMLFWTLFQPRVSTVLIKILLLMEATHTTSFYFQDSFLPHCLTIIYTDELWRATQNGHSTASWAQFFFPVQRAVTTFQ